MFESHKAYDDHLEHDHANDSADLRSFELLRAGESSDTKAICPCPFCGKQLGTVLEFDHPITVHIQRIAIFTLSRSTDQEENSGNGSD
jgi:hypothetical protein